MKYAQQDAEPQNKKKYNKSGIYEMKYSDCLLKYVEQTDTTFAPDTNSILKQLTHDTETSC
jgi:hypothetical protein